jgi:hypothetical protein
MTKKAAGGDKQKKARQEYNVSPAEFVKVWQSSETTQEVSDRLGMPKPIVLARASSYRKDGIKLKKLRRDRKNALDIDGLNRLIEEMGERPVTGRKKRADAPAQASHEEVVREVSRLIEERRKA